MEILEIIFSGEVIFALFFIFSLIIVVSAIILFLEESGDLRARLFHTDLELNKRREELPEKKERVEEMKAEVLNLKRDFYKVRTFYRKVSDLELEAMRKEEDKDFFYSSSDKDLK
tara:strand:+ start:232 stop:576 length:345 start_codon:yes stop_codon:yes gene_type:complete